MSHLITAENLALFLHQAADRTLPLAHRLAYLDAVAPRRRALSEHQAYTLVQVERDLFARLLLDGPITADGVRYEAQDHRIVRRLPS